MRYFGHNIVMELECLSIFGLNLQIEHLFSSPPAMLFPHLSEGISCFTPRLLISVFRDGMGSSVPFQGILPGSTLYPLIPFKGPRPHRMQRKRSHDAGGSLCGGGTCKTLPSQFSHCVRLRSEGKVRCGILTQLPFDSKHLLCSPQDCWFRACAGGRDIWGRRIG